MSGDLYKDLGLKVKGQKYRFVDTDANMDDDGFLPIENSSAPQGETYSLANINNKNKDNKIDTLTENFQNNITNRSGAEEANIKRTIKKLNQQTPKYLKQTKTDITDKEERIAERQVTYENLTQDISTYQEKVNKINDADVVNFALTKFKNNTTLNSIKQNSKLNSFEDAINKTLVKNKYETDEKILEEERNKLYASVNPEIIKQRYEELKKMRSLMYQQEIKNMHKNKIKSKLYHKIKKKQKQKQEDKLLEQLKEIDPEAVNEYLKKKMEQRVDERISLKHTLNKFNKTVKRYNLLYDPNVKESLMENYRKRDKLLEKVRNPNADEDDDDDEVDDDEEEENEEEDEYIDVDDEEIEDEDKDEDNEMENVDSKIDKKQILIDFNEKKDKKKEKKDAGVLGMNFMKKSNELSEQVNSLIKNTSGKDDNKKDSEEVEYSNKTKIQFKLGGNKKKDNKEEKIDINQKILMNSKSERLGKLEEGNESKNTKDRKNSIDDRYNKLTSSMLNKITYEKNTKDSNNNYDLQLTENLVDEIVKENKNRDEENLLKSFLIENNEVSYIIYINLIYLLFY